MSGEVLVDIYCQKCGEYQLCYVAATQAQTDLICAKPPVCVSCQIETVLATGVQPAAARGEGES